MRKVQLTAVVWTMILAVPLTALALSGLAYTTEHMTQITTSIANFSREVSVEGRGLSVEFAARWPEVMGMIIGQIVILAILIFARQNGKAEDVTTKNQ